jgi:hypothetical protein
LQGKGYGYPVKNVHFEWDAYKDEQIRIIGAGYWRRGKEAYEEKNKIL